MIRQRIFVFQVTIDFNDLLLTVCPFEGRPRYSSPVNRSWDQAFNYLDNEFNSQLKQILLLIFDFGCVCDVFSERSFVIVCVTDSTTNSTALGAE